MQHEIRLTYKQIAQLPEKVMALYEGRGIRIRSGTDLAKMIDLCGNVDSKVDGMGADQLFEVCCAMRVLKTIVDCSSEAEITEALARIATKPLSSASSVPSAGKDALFELEFLQYARIRNLSARLGEPDVVIKAPFGDYFVACKSINSLNNLRKQLSKGSKQVERYGHGCIAFNFEPHMCFEQPLRARSARKVAKLMDTQLHAFYDNYTRLFDQRLSEGSLDGVVLQMSCIVDMTESHFDLNVFTHTVYYSRSNLQEPDAHDRFNGFRMAMKGPLGRVRN